MTEKEIEVLAQACKASGIDATKIKPENPFTNNGGTATMLQAAVAEFHPEQAAMWRVAAGGSLSLATMAEHDLAEATALMGAGLHLLQRDQSWSPYGWS